MHFLEFLIETQAGAYGNRSKTLTSDATPTDAFAELKRLQDELHEEIGPLKDKIKADLQPAAQQGGAGTAAQGSSQELEKGIALLQGWADAAGEKMSSAARKLTDRQAEPAATDHNPRSTKWRRSGRQ